MKNFSKYLDSVVEKALNEALESKADKIVSEIQKKMETTEKLHGKQHKLDKNKNGRLDKQDFKMLRKEDNEEQLYEVEFEKEVDESWRRCRRVLDLQRS